jgi:hypothetical protein
MRAVAPGDYTVLAWEQVDAGAWMNEEFLSSVEQRGSSVRVPAGSTAQVTTRIITAP